VTVGPHRTVIEPARGLFPDRPVPCGGRGMIVHNYVSHESRLLIVIGGSAQPWSRSHVDDGPLGPARCGGESATVQHVLREPSLVGQR